MGLESRELPSHCPGQLQGIREILGLEEQLSLPRALLEAWEQQWGLRLALEWPPSPGPCLLPGMEPGSAPQLLTDAAIRLETGCQKPVSKT